MAHVPIHPKTRLCPGTPRDKETPSDRVPVFYLSLCICLSFPHEVQPRGGGSPEAVSSTQASSPEGAFFFFFLLDRGLRWRYVFGYTWSVLLHSTPRLPGETARCGSVKENRYLHLPEALAWMHIQQVHIIGAIHHFQERGVHSKLWHSLVGQETAVSPRISALGSQDDRNP